MPNQNVLLPFHQWGVEFAQSALQAQTADGAPVPEDQRRELIEQVLAGEGASGGPFANGARAYIAEHAPGYLEPDA